MITYIFSRNSINDNLPEYVYFVNNSYVIFSSRLRQETNQPEKSSSSENEATVCISQREYSQLLQSYVENLRLQTTITNLKQKCQSKAIEIKHLQYYKKKFYKSTKNLQ